MLGHARSHTLAETHLGVDNPEFIGGLSNMVMFNFQVTLLECNVMLIQMLIPVFTCKQSFKEQPYENYSQK